MAQPNLATRNLAHSSYIGDFQIGVVYHHGAIQITPSRNRAFIDMFGDGLLLGANHALAMHLGYKDPDADVKMRLFGPFGIEPTSLVSQGFLFNVVFGLSVRDISFNAVANISYSNLRFGVPVFEGDTISAKSEVLGTSIRDDAASGRVQVKTTGRNQRGETVLEYVRLVLVNAVRGQTPAKPDTTKKQPEKIDLEELWLPNVYHDLPKELLGKDGMTFEQFEVGKTYHGLLKGGLDLRTANWLTAATLNDAGVHQDSTRNFLVYGGAVKALAEGHVSGLLPLARHIGMITGTHDAQTYPSDFVQSRYAAGEEGRHEELWSRIEVVGAASVPDREDIGILTVRLITDKLVTDAGMRALEAVLSKDAFKNLKIRQEGPERLLQVLSLEEVLAVPTEMAFV